MTWTKPGLVKREPPEELTQMTLQAASQIMQGFKLTVHKAEECKGSRIDWVLLDETLRTP